MPWSFDLDRPLLAPEALVLQGFPAFESLETACGVERPFDYIKFEGKAIWSMAGNGQSVPVMGMAFMWFLACTCKREHAGPLLPVLEGGWESESDSD